MDAMSPITAVLEVFSLIGEWFLGIVNDMVAMFFDPATGLTFIGTMAVAALGISLILLVIAAIRSYLQFRA